MYNLLLICNNLKNIKQLYNNVIEKIGNIKLIGIINSVDELENIIPKKNPDIVLICNMDHYHILRSESLNYNPIIIVISDFQTQLKKYENKICIKNNCSFTYIEKQITNFISSKSKDIIRKEIVNIFLDLQFDFKLIGTKYLIESIIFSYINRDSYAFENLEKAVYPHVAENNKTSMGNVKWAIIRSINNMYFNHTTESVHKLEDYFCISFPEKPTSKLVIGMIVNRLRNNS